MKQPPSGSYTGVALAFAGAVLMAVGIVLIPVFVDAQKETENCTDASFQKRAAHAVGADNDKMVPRRERQAGDEIDTGAPSGGGDDSSATETDAQKETSVSQSSSETTADGEGTSWRIVTDGHRFSLDATAEEMVAAAAAAALASPGRTVSVVATNNARRSTKLAIHAASVVKNYMQQTAAIPDARFLTDYTQEPDLESVYVTISLKDGDQR